MTVEKQIPNDQYQRPITTKNFSKNQNQLPLEPIPTTNHKRSKEYNLAKVPSKLHVLAQSAGKITPTKWCDWFCFSSSMRISSQPRSVAIVITQLLWSHLKTELPQSSISKRSLRCNSRRSLLNSHSIALLQANIAHPSQVPPYQNPPSLEWQLGQEACPVVYALQILRKSEQVIRLQTRKVMLKTMQW